MKDKGKFAHKAVILSLLLAFPHLLTAALPAETATQTTADAAAKTSRLLQESGYAHRKTGDHTWLIERMETNKPPILVANGPDFLVVGIIVAEKKNMRVSADLSLKLLKLNHSLDYVKCGLDADDDLFVRSEVRIRVTDLAAFKALVEGVISGADRAYAEVKPFLITP
ncbi:MAG: YbjN domain-containing protein [Pyrinomonadaceae bacterium]|nr:YbjN domain-containing protein [Pyrinomonadaceae bacterium]